MNKKVYIFFCPGSLYQQLVTAPTNLRLVGNYDVIEGSKLNISCVYDTSVPVVETLKFCIGNDCITQSAVSFNVLICV